MIRLSACLIVRDEAAHLPRCLKSIKPVIDEIIVVDTGSVDDSAAIAVDFGARLFRFAWCDDFSAARNMALAQARGDWILYIDADEELIAESTSTDFLDCKDAIAATVSFRAARHLTTYAEHRLFRNRHDLRFQGKIHETIMPDVHRLRAEQGLKVIESPWAIEHYGYEGDLDHKHRRNHPLLLEAVQDDPGRLYLWHALGECELGLGNPQAAERAWREGLAILRTHPEDPGGPMLFANLMALHLQEELILEDIAALADEAVRLCPGDPLVLWWLGRYHCSAGDDALAHEVVLQLEEIAVDEPARASLGYDRRLFGEYLWSLSGNCALQRGDNAAAVAWFSRAAQVNPHEPEYQVKLALAQARSRH